jgi:hypothetical protein
MNKEKAALVRNIYIMCNGKIVEENQHLDTEVCNLIFDVSEEESLLQSLAVPILAFVVLLGAFLINNA